MFFPSILIDADVSKAPLDTNWYMSIEKIAGIALVLDTPYTDRTFTTSSSLSFCAEDKGHQLSCNDMAYKIS